MSFRGEPTLWRIALIPSWAVWNKDGTSAGLSEKRLVRVLDKYCPQIPGYFLYYPSRLNLAPKLKVLIDFLKKSKSRRGPSSGEGESRTRSAPSNRF